MADEEDAKKTTTDETVESEDKASSRPPERAASGMNTIVVIAVGLAVIIVTPLLSLLVNKSMAPTQIEGDVKKEDAGKQTTFVMDEIRVNILGTKATRYVVMTPHLVLSDSGLQEGLLELKPMLADRVSTTISRRTLDELEGPEARISLRRDIMNEVNAAVRSRMEGAVVDVYLVDYLIQ